MTDVKLSFRPGRESDSEAEDIEHAEKLRQVKAVLEEVNLDSTSTALIQCYFFCCLLVDKLDHSCSFNSDYLCACPFYAENVWNMMKLPPFFVPILCGCLVCFILLHSRKFHLKGEISEILGVRASHLPLRAPLISLLFSLLLTAFL